MLVARCFGVLSSTLWGAGALFAVLLALIVSGATIIVLMCLLMLADLTENRPKDAFAGLLFHRQGMGMNSEFCLTRTQVHLRCHTFCVMDQKLTDAIR